MVTGLILHVSAREQKSVPINIISIRLACALSFRRQLNFIPAVSEKGRGYWKIKNSILQEVEYQLMINNLIDNYIYDKVNHNVDVICAPFAFWL
jgi:hypothetical protein